MSWRRGRALHSGRNTKVQRLSKCVRLSIIGIGIMLCVKNNFLIAFFALPIAAIWLKEELSLMAILGGLLVLVSTIIITMWEYKQNKPRKSMKRTTLTSTNIQ